MCCPARRRGAGRLPLRSEEAHAAAQGLAHASSNDAATVAGWWTQWPGAVPALDLARCGLVVLDGDRHHPGVDGVAALRELLKQQPGLRRQGAADGEDAARRRARLLSAVPAGAGQQPRRPAGRHRRARRRRLRHRARRRARQPPQLRADRGPARAGRRLRRQDHPGGAGRHRRPDQAGRQHRAQQARNGRDRAAGARERAYAKAALRRIASELASAPPGTATTRSTRPPSRWAPWWRAAGSPRRRSRTRSPPRWSATATLADKGSKAIAATLASGLKAGMRQSARRPARAGHPAGRLRQPRSEPHLFLPAVPRAVARRQRQRPAAQDRGDDRRRRAQGGRAERLARPASLGRADDLVPGRADADPRQAVRRCRRLGRAAAA